MNCKFKILGVTDAINHCDRCGRTELKRVYVIETAAGETYSLGSQCIRKAYQMTQRELTTKLKEDQQVARSAAGTEFMATDAYRFLKNYLGSPQHHEDMKRGGYTLVSGIIAPHRRVKQLIAEKYRVSTHRF